MQKNRFGFVTVRVVFVFLSVLTIALLGIFVSTKIQNQKTAIISPVLPKESSSSATETTQSAEAKLGIVETKEPPIPLEKPEERKETPKVVGVNSARGQVFYGRGTPNNKFGMYVNNISKDIKDAAELINSNGGKWGYVLLTMEINDRDKSKWQDMFDQASKSQLIPIVQLYNNNQCKVDKMNFDSLAEMLNKLKWPSKYRYISVFNEVNAKDYWCERIAPDEYAKALDKAIKAFKKKSDNFFIMPAAFNSSARSQDRYMSEDSFLVKMNQTVPGIFKKIDGWATHSYPHPNFSGDPNNLPGWYGPRDTINNYTWEMNILRNNFGVGPFPIFITETGWLHKEGQSSCVQYSQKSLLAAETTSARFKNAFTNYWLNDARIVAITPFIFRSNDPCAEGFAWQKKGGGWYPQANMLMAIPKTAGSPN
ncbi:MAG: hypothetical protein AAB443_02020 [Patescibacteria group bacterium]